MGSWKLDDRGIFISNNNIDISYPDSGNMDCYQLEDVSPWFHYRNELISLYLDKFGLSYGDFLDIGGGNGFQIQYIEKTGKVKGRSILVEPGYNGCQNAKNRGCDLVYNGIFQDFPWEDFNVSMAGLFDVIEHIEDDIEFLNDLYKKLPQGARVFINVPSKMSLWSSVDIESEHYRRYEISDIERLVDKTGFKLLESTFYFKFFELPLYFARVLPEKLGILGNSKKDIEKIKLNNIKNLKRGNSGILSAYFNYQHKKAILKLKTGKKIKSGTSLFFILEK